MRSHHLIFMKRVTAYYIPYSKSWVVSCCNKQECRLKATSEKNGNRLLRCYAWGPQGDPSTIAITFSYQDNADYQHTHTAHYQTLHGLIHGSFANMPRHTHGYQNSNVFETIVNKLTLTNCSGKCMELRRQFLDKLGKNYNHMILK